MLIALSGLPGVGKTTIARALCRRWPAVHLRIDTIEQALLRCGFAAPPGPEGYAVAGAIAADNLRLGHRVVADCVNAVPAARQAWMQVALSCQVACLQVHLTCGDADVHRQRMSRRQADIEGHVLPSWSQVSAMTIDTPDEALVIDTSACTVDDAVARILGSLGPG